MTWQGFSLLSLAAYRLTRLIGWDDLTVTPRRLLTGVSDTDHEAIAEYVDELERGGSDPWAGSPESVPPISRRRFYLSKMIRCPWCLGWWVSLTITVVWWIVEDGMLVSVPLIALAVSAAVGLIAKLDE